MPKIRKIILTNNAVSDVAVFDTDNIPDWAYDEGWVDAPDGTSIGDTSNGDGTYTTPPPPTKTPEELDAEQEVIAQIVMENRGALKALALTMLHELNIIRVAVGQSERTNEQLRAAVKANAD